MTSLLFDNKGTAINATPVTTKVIFGSMKDVANLMTFIILVKEKILLGKYTSLINVKENTVLVVQVKDKNHCNQRSNWHQIAA